MHLRNFILLILAYSITTSVLAQEKKQYKLYDTIKYQVDTNSITGELSKYIELGNGNKMMFSYHLNSNLKCKGLYRDNHRHGAWLFYSDIGILLMETNYVMGCKSGIEIFYYDDGSYKIIGNYPLIFSDQMENFNSGTNIVKHYSDGISVTLSSSCDAPKHGIWIYFSPQGVVEKVEKFNMGILCQ